MRRNAMVLALTILALAACGDDSTGPKDANVNGAWSYHVQNLTGSGITCDLLADLALTQNGKSFTGTYANGHGLCTAGVDTLPFDSAAGNVVSGTVNGNAVTFQFDDDRIAHSGTVTSGSMSGTTTWHLPIGNGGSDVTLTGDWTATQTAASLVGSPPAASVAGLRATQWRAAASGRLSAMP